MSEMISPTSGAERDGTRTLLGASALTAGVVGVVAAASALAPADFDHDLLLTSH